jgi:hypothetical protein
MPLQAADYGGGARVGLARPLGVVSVVKQRYMFSVMCGRSGY